MFRIGDLYHIYSVFIDFIIINEAKNGALKL